ncbi:MAG: 50S ribosomal protein L19e [Candidatus Aenigmatarchaeota archaeon]
MDLKEKRKLAAKILKCGLDRVWIDPKRIKEVEEALTRRDIKRLIGSGVIKKLPKKGNSKRERRKRRGKGSIKGHRKDEAKKQWMKKIRAQRRYLKYLRDKGMISKKSYKELYKKAKAGMFKSKSELKLYIDHNEMWENNKNIKSEDKT